MRLITLITDFGLKDYYASTLKGRLYSASDQIAFVDVTHQVEPFNITEAAFNLKGSIEDAIEAGEKMLAEAKN